MPVVSVIIPCYNLGAHLDEAVGSVLAQGYDDLEIIVVDDGSTDVETRRIVGEFSRPKTRVILTENGGVSRARNIAIEAAAGRYILPLDADDLIAGDYIRQAVEVLDRNPQVGVVSCNMEFFGATNYRPVLPPFTPADLVVRNELPCSSFFRKSLWEQAGGYDPEMDKGWEDWEFWLSLVERGAQVHRLPGTYFRYRIRPGSRERSLTRDDRRELYLRMYQRHPEFYHRHMDVIFNEICDYQDSTSSQSYRFINYITHPSLVVKKIKNRVLRLANVGGHRS